MKKIGIILSTIPERFTKLDFDSLAIVNNCNEIELTIVLDFQFKDFPDREFLRTLNDCRVKVISGDFGNPGLTRNYGLVNSDSEWVLFWDDDDIPNYQFVIELAQGNLLDSRFAFHVFEYSELSLRNTRKISFSNSHDYDSNCRLLSTRLGIWRCVLLRNRLGKRGFPSLMMGEDQCFIFEQDYSNQEIVFHDSNLYTYLRHSANQLTSQKMHRKKVLEAWSSMASIASTTHMNSLSKRLLCNIFVTSIVQCGFVGVIRSIGLIGFIKLLMYRNLSLGNVLSNILTKLHKRYQIA